MIRATEVVDAFLRKSKRPLNAFGIDHKLIGELSNRIIGKYRENSPMKINSMTIKVGPRTITELDWNRRFQFGAVQYHKWSLELRGLDWLISYNLRTDDGRPGYWMAFNKESDSEWVAQFNPPNFKIFYKHPFESFIGLTKKEQKARDCVNDSIKSLNISMLSQYVRENTEATVYVDEQDHNFLHIVFKDFEMIAEIPSKLAIAVILDGKLEVDQRLKDELESIVPQIVGNPGDLESINIKIVPLRKARKELVEKIKSAKIAKNVIRNFKIRSEHLPKGFKV